MAAAHSRRRCSSLYSCCSGHRRHCTDRRHSGRRLCGGPGRFGRMWLCSCSRLRSLPPRCGHLWAALRRCCPARHRSEWAGGCAPEGRCRQALAGNRPRRAAARDPARCSSECWGSHGRPCRRQSASPPSPGGSTRRQGRSSCLCTRPAAGCNRPSNRRPGLRFALGRGRATLRGRSRCAWRFHEFARKRAWDLGGGGKLSFRACPSRKQPLMSAADAREGFAGPEYRARQESRRRCDAKGA